MAPLKPVGEFITLDSARRTFHGETAVAPLKRGSAFVYIDNLSAAFHGETAVAPLKRKFFRSPV